MEYGLRLFIHLIPLYYESCLNPCCNGIWSQTLLSNPLIQQIMRCLNPCCNGIWSQTIYVLDQLREE